MVEINFAHFHYKQQMSFATPRPRFDFAVNQSNNSAITLETLEQRNLVHVSVHGLCVGFVKGDTFDSEQFAGMVKNPEDTG